MKKGFCFTMALTILVIAFCSLNSFALEGGKNQVTRISEPATAPVLALSPATTDYCEILIDDGIPKDQYTSFDSGMGVAVYMDPEECGGDPYPFQVTGVYLYLYEPLSGDYLWPIDIQINICDLGGEGKCGGPDSILASETFSIPADSAYPLMMNLTLSEPCCVSGPFFLEVVYLTPAGDSTLPSLVMDGSLATSSDTCDNWFLNTDGYHSWVDFWGSPSIGDGMIRAHGHVDSWECHGPWRWEPDTTEAPSGTPDFDQFQFGDSIALCGPAAAANCLWWLEAFPQETDPVDLVRLLSDYFGTDPESGTLVDSIASGLNRYFEDYDFQLEAAAVERPDFYEISDLLLQNENMVLLLGFWQLDMTWNRVGGHFVSLAGACVESTDVALSDPARDAAEDSWSGRVRPTEHPSHTLGDTLHNDTEYVSHDIYWLLTESHLGGDWRLVQYHEYAKIDLFEGQNFQPDQEPYAVPYDSILPIYTEVEYAVLIHPKPSGVEDEIGTSIPKDFELLQNHPNPFNMETVIRYHLRKPSAVTLNVYNILGQKVATLVDEYQQAGTKTVIWDGKDKNGDDLASSVYFYELRAGDVKQSKRMVLLK